ncbi:Ig-like domain-containing protein [Longimicrobium sp.]|uniref:Ig-like domain-containing protein n=1 Tax=Longimicrobium sp. TaxID=2029185 RepID=UPI002D7E288A|nr:Ig-like domain-containing protein [Longimicrobium sp.]
MAVLAACDGGGSSGTAAARDVFIRIANADVEIAPGDQARIEATVVGGNASAVPEWRTSSPSIVTVDGSGTVRGLAEGEATVTAVYGSATSNARVRVKPHQVSRVVATPDAVILRALGDSVRLSATAYDAQGNALATTVGWSTADTGVATVSPTGMVVARGTGLARVVAAASGKADTSMIQVVQLVAAVALTPAVASLQTGQSLSLQAVARDSNGAVVPGTGYTWTSSAPAIATVDASGMVRSLAAGSAVVTAAAPSGVAAQAQVSVQAVPIASLAVSPTSFALAPGQNAQAAAVAKDAGGNVLTGRVVAWSSSNPAVANVSPLGVVFALADGSATITATAEGKTASAPVAVKTPVTTTPPPTTGTPTVLASSTFETGTLSPFTYPWDQYPSDLSVVNDPTGAGHGRVVSIHYAGTAADRNRGVMYESNAGVGLGQTIVFRGDLYVGQPLPGSEPAGRKLLYFQRDESTGFPDFSTVLALYGYTLIVSQGYGPSGFHQDVGLATLQAGRWYKLEMEQRLNTSFTAKDGVIRVWVDGALVYERTNLTWSDPAWTASPANQKFRYFIVGDQVNYGGTFDEMRYWDNITFSTGRLAR